ncbi:MAG: LPS export ABC transporter permease LptF [Paracoccaceae bacterium]
MSRYDRYVLAQYLLLFGFFALILVAVFWINRAVVLFETLIGDGQSALVFLEFTALALPNLVRIVLPIAAFGSAVWVTNRLNSESELTVMQATGFSPWRLARPALAFGLVAGAMMTALTHFLLPASINQLDVREREIARNATARLLTEGSFLHPSAGVAFFIGEVDDNGTLHEVFLSDRRDPKQSVVYTGARAFLVRDQGRAHLIMVDGVSQRRDNESNTLSTTAFDDFSYDITSVLEKTESGKRHIRAIPSRELLFDRAAIRENEGYTDGQMAEEFHLRFARALICIAVALIGFSALLVGGFSRFGVWKQGIGAFGLLIVLEGMRGVVSEPVLEDASKWPLIYIPSVLGFASAALFLSIASRPLPKVFKRKQSTEALP